jgi:hypothetical protein
MTYPTKTSQLTTEKVIELTCPFNMSLRMWRELLKDAHESSLVWEDEDPWLTPQ